MTEIRPQTLTCPSCGAPLEFEGASPLVRCKFCKTNVILPGLPESGASPEALAEIRRLAQKGNMLEAIKRYRSLFADLGLKEAKDAVEALAAGGAEEARVMVSGPLTPEQTGHILEQVQELLREGNKIEAIKVYRESSDVSLTRAKAVIDRVEAALKGLPLPPEPGISGTPVQVQPRLKIEPQPAKKSWLGCVILLLILGLVGGILAIIFFSRGGPFNPFLIANGPAVLVTSGSGAAAVAATFYDSNAEKYRVGLVDGEGGKLMWQAGEFSSDGYLDAIVQSGNLVYAASRSDLVAYQLSDGSLAWEAVMPDELNYSESNILVAGGRVITSNLDQSIQAYDAATGALAWSRRLNGYDRDLRLVGGSLVVIDTPPDEYEYSLIFLNPVDGSEQKVLTPTCQEDEYSTARVDPDSGFHFDEAENSLYLVYDSSPGCIQRLDLTTGQAAWTTLDDEWYSFSPNGFNGLLTAQRIYFNNGSELLAVDRRTGALQTLLAEEDYEFIPLALSGETLLVRARWTRGTERFELRGVNPATGRALWQMSMGDSKPIDPPNDLVGLVDEDESGWTWNILDGELVLIHFQAGPNQLLIRQVSLADGTVSSEGIVPLKSVSGDFYSVPEVIGWQGSRVYLNIDVKIYCVDVVTGEVIFHYQ